MVMKAAVTMTGRLHPPKALVYMLTNWVAKASALSAKLWPVPNITNAPRLRNITAVISEPK